MNFTHNFFLHNLIIIYNLVYTFVILIATIYIPFVISFIDRLKNKLDTKIFFSLKFNIRKILFLYGIIFLLLLFWSKDNFYFINSYILLLILILIYFLIKELVILNDYFLINSEKINKERLDFIPKLNFKNDIEIWGDSFKLDLIKDYNFSKRFTEIFFEKIKNEISNIVALKLEKEKYILVENIRSLLIAYNELEYDSIFYSFFDSDKNLKLFLNIYKELYSQEKKYAIWFRSDLWNILEKKLEKLNSDNHGIWVFYKILVEHIKENKEDIKYIKRLISNLLHLYFENDIILENRSLVENFPYKIKLSLLSSKDIKEYEKELFRSIFDKTLNYIIKDIQQHYLDEKIVLNNKIQNILNYWFTEFEDIITFSDILFMLFVPYGDNRAESIIKGIRTFGHISRIKTFVGSISNEELSKDSINEYKNTIDKFKKYLPGLLNKENLEKLKKEFNNIINNKDLEKGKILKAKRYKKLIKDLLI